MKVLLATDGSSGAAVAEKLVGSLRWPDGTEIVIVRVALPIFAGGDQPPDAYTALHERRQREANKDLARILTALAGEGRAVRTRMLLGRPASAIVDQARRLNADVIVLGSRGLGPFKSAILGSVAAEVVDHAPCAVLIARAPAVTGVVLGADGSSEAAFAEALLSEWPVFHQLPVRIVAVATIPPIVLGSFVRHAAASVEQALAVEAIRAAALRIADASAVRLRAAGLQAEASVRGGDPAHELIEAANEVDADLLVTGSRGVTGLERLLLGSVARGVLHHAPCSVLIARRAAKVGPIHADGADKISAALAR